MNFKKISFSALPILVLAFTSCSNDDDKPADETLNYTVPATYSFERNAVTSVDYSGQSSRILMLDEMSTYIKTQASAGASIDNEKLSSMYVNANNQFSSTELNSSGKQIKDKTAASLDYFENFNGGGSIIEKSAVQAFFETQFVNMNMASQGKIATAGIEGKYGTGSSTRYFSNNGLEPREVFLKGTIGSSFLDQIVNTYLSIAKLEAGTNKIDNTNKKTITGKNYTNMEHFWDEAYGYVYGASGDKFLSEYITKVNADTDFNTIKADIHLAFRTGRAAIVANDYQTRDAQITIIKEKLAKVCAVRAVFYLQTGKTKLVTDNGAAAFHDLSEGYGFIMSLRYTNKPGTNNPYFTKAEVDAMLASMLSDTNGLWAIDTLGAKLDAISLQIATKFGFTVAQAATVN